MNPGDKKSNLVIGGFVALCGLLAVSFFFAPDEAPVRQAPGPLTPAPAIATVRISAPQLIASGGDASILDCYACHDEDAPPDVVYADDGRLILPPEHSDLSFMMYNCNACHEEDSVELEYDDDFVVIMPEAHANLLAMGHGRNNRNNNCYNCHNRAKLDQLITRDGTLLGFEQAPLLCASCHGPTYRDWELGMHGRINGYWDTSAGEALKQDCNACHDPHSPAFPQVIPLPGPRPVLTGANAAHAEGEGEED